MVNIKELKALALAATPGPWFAVNNGTYHDIKTEDGLYTPTLCSVVGSPFIEDPDNHGTETRNAAHIAAANPAALLQLIASYEAIVAAGKLFTEAMDSCMNYPDTDTERERLIEAAKAMDAALSAAEKQGD